MTETKLLNLINSPTDLKALKPEQLSEVCHELRQYIIDEAAHNPGHFGANLGVIELTVALHYVYNTPYDRIVWDVGHQAYAHKILTGRREAFKTNRQFKGLCGFPNPSESPYDAFAVGHASTSISSALGMSIAAQLHHEDRQVVAVIGDGSMTGGLAFEGLNNASINPNNLLVILNDNNMAIDPIKGGINHYLASIHTSKTYNKVRYASYKMLSKMHIISEKHRSQLIRFGNSLKSLHRNNARTNIFEGLDMRYFGPFDGHDLPELLEILKEIKNHKGPKVLHLVTKKGKGYSPAEKAAPLWHAPGLFDIQTGQKIKADSTNNAPKFQKVFGETLLELAHHNKQIVGVTPAMPSGCSMDIMLKEMPDRTFDVGIAEAHAVTFSAGMAKDGLMPFCNIYSTFMQRAYDNVIHDVALQNLNVCFCLDRGGLVGNDGATHQGQFDMASFRCIPNMTLAAPMDEHELRNLMYTAQLPNQGPFMIRYPRGNGSLPDWQNKMQEITIGKGRTLRSGKKIAILSIGSIGARVQKALDNLALQGYEFSHYDMRFIKPLDSKLIEEAIHNHDQLITVEEGCIIGGFGSAILEYLADNNHCVKIKRIGLPDQFIEHGSQSELYEMLKIDAKGIQESILNIYNEITK